MVDSVCSKCDVGWKIHAHDRYCGYCGCQVFDFSESTNVTHRQQEEGPPYLRRLPNNSRLLVCDFEGNTIDIGLLQVTQKNNEIKIERLASRENPKYGGDDLTQAIIGFVLDEFEQRVRRVTPNLSFNIPYLKPRETLQPSDDPEVDKAIAYNTAILYSKSEEMKKALNEQTEIEESFPLLCVIGGNIYSHIYSIEILTGGIEVKLSKQRLQSSTEDELSKTFADINTMIADNEERTPDLVILTGESSKMPAVKKMMAAHFQREYRTTVDIHLEERSKIADWNMEI